MYQSLNGERVDETPCYEIVTVGADVLIIPRKSVGKVRRWDHWSAESITSEPDGPEKQFTPTRVGCLFKKNVERFSILRAFRIQNCYVSAYSGTQTFPVLLTGFPIVFRLFVGDKVVPVLLPLRMSSRDGEYIFMQHSLKTGKIN